MDLGVLNDKIFQWHSSDIIGTGKEKKPVINSLLATFTLTTGMHVDQVSWLED